MTISFRCMTVEAFVPILENLHGILGKAVDQSQERGLALTDLLDARLAPDMWPLDRQVRFTCWQAVNGTARLAQVSPLESDEGENDFATLRSRILDSIRFLEHIPIAAFEEAEDRTICHVNPDGRIFTMSSIGYLRDWLNPMFYFHATTAYGILRSQGMDIGKMDFLHHCASAMRWPGQTPSG